MIYAYTTDDDEGRITFYVYGVMSDFNKYKMSYEFLVDEKHIPQNLRDMMRVMDAGANEGGDFTIAGVCDRDETDSWAAYYFYGVWDEIAQLRRKEQQNGTLDDSKERCA